MLLLNYNHIIIIIIDLKQILSYSVASLIEMSENTTIRLLDSSHTYTEPLLSTVNPLGENRRVPCACGTLMVDRESPVIQLNTAMR